MQKFGVVLLAMAACACSTSVDIDLNTPQKPVLNLLASAGSPVTLSLSTTWHYDKPDEKRYPTDYEAVLTVNGQFVETMSGLDSDDPDCGHQIKSDYIVREGDKIEVSVVTADYGTLKAATEVPEKVSIESTDFTYTVYEDHNSMWSDGVNIYYSTTVRFNYRITFTDPAGEENYYMLSGNVYPSDPIFDENQNAIDGIIDNDNYSYFSIFSDRSIDGKTYALNCFTLHYNHPYYGSHDGSIDRIGLYSISRDYYHYLLSVLKKDSGLQGTLDEIGLGEPQTVFTNIEGGLGIAASQSGETVEVDVSEFIEEALGKQAM
ncbi:MAG: DUF4249 domain-containing protein [Muribaculaceae bacterium]|nr:DUF4249 domain-containing protein [Muribaculaceae bacterium]